jgi:hypothetical protein
MPPVYVEIADKARAADRGLSPRPAALLSFEQ